MSPAARHPRRAGTRAGGTRPGPVALVIVVLALLVAACSGGSGGGPSDAATATTATAAPVTTVAPTTAPPTTTAPPVTTVAPTTSVPGSAGARVRFVAIGDSYSAGIGASTPEVDVSRSCSRDPVASLGTLAAAALVAQGFTVDLDLRACSGGTVAQVVQQADDVQGADAISVTFGGNDFGFSRIIGDCLLRGCRSYDQPGDRLPGLAHENGQDDWQVLQARLVDGLGALRPHLAPGGRVYLLTYPIPFPADPDPTCLQTTAPFDDTNRVLVNAATDRLDRALTDAVAAANAAAGAPFVEVVEWRTGLDRPLRTVADAAGTARQVRDNPNGICSPDPFVNGITASTALGDSFHPTDRGHAFAADALARAIRARNPPR